MPGQQIPNSCFTVMGEDDMSDAVVEFFLSATINIGADGTQVNQICLLSDGVVVAKAEYDGEEDNGLHRNFAIFYKAKVLAGMPQEFEIQASTSDAGVEPVVFDMDNNNLGLQWGYRVYSADYPLVDTVPTCWMSNQLKQWERESEKDLSRPLNK